MTKGHHRDDLPCTSRQLEILRKSAEGLLLKEIATVLGISRRTAHFHAQQAIHRLSCGTLTQAVAKQARLDANRKIRELEAELVRLRGVLAHRRPDAA